jgi:EAL domain-containing protein (putative c-di-GMP-specific phosphodiesterase class I)
MADPALHAQLSSRVNLEAEFQTAIAHGELRLFFQPVVNIHASTIGAEALVRWQHPKNGLISPAHFIGMAEETGLIIPMGWWVLRAACQQLAEWARVPYKASWTIAVNVSAKQFLQNNFVDEVQSILVETGINPRRLKLELTESVMVQHVEDAIAKMSVLQAQGIKFSLDDFGTGYSSLSYLKRLPLQQLKIDQSFVRDIHNDPNDAAIVKTILALAHSMELSVVAEGVETLEQEEFLIAAGCRYMQGYLYGRPVPVSQWA